MVKHVILHHLNLAVRRLTKLQLLRYFDCDAFLFFQLPLSSYFIQTGIIDDDVELSMTVIFVKHFLQSYSSKPTIICLKPNMKRLNFLV